MFTDNELRIIRALCLTEIYELNEELDNSAGYDASDIQSMKTRKNEISNIIDKIDID